MPITRAKASRLLNQSEMGLYDDSRANGLRELDAKALASRVKRARTARDRARDLVQKQKLASRARSGSKRGTSGADNQRSKDKAELTADILKRFEQQLKVVERADRDGAKAAAKGAKAPAKKRAATKSTSKKASAKKTSAKPASTTKAASRKAASKTPAAKQAATERQGGAKAGSRKAASKAPATKKAAKQADATSPTTYAAGSRKKATDRKASASGATPRATSAARPKTTTAKKATRRRHITPEQALEQTRALLEAKQAHDAEPKPWQDLPAGPAASGEPGFQSDAAARRAARLHAAEARIPAIQGSVSTRDRINQGKRDHRGDGD